MSDENKTFLIIIVKRKELEVLNLKRRKGAKILCLINIKKILM